MAEAGEEQPLQEPVRDITALPLPAVDGLGQQETQEGEDMAFVIDQEEEEQQETAVEPQVFTETTAVLDKNVFDFGFHTVDILPVVTRVSVAPEFRRIAAGQTVAITIHVIDNMTTYGRSYPFNPAIPPKMVLYNPDGSVLLSAVDMAQLETGIYTYVYQTNPLAEPGAYSASFNAQNGSAYMQTPKMVVYTVIYQKR